MNAFIVKEFTREQAQELHRLTSTVTGMLMRLLMSNIELSGKIFKAADGSIDVPVVKGEHRSRLTVQRQQQQPQQQLARSKSRSTVRTMSRTRPMFSAIVKGANEAMPVDEVKQRMVANGAPARVKAIKNIKEGGILVETCSKKELDDLVDSITEMDVGLVAHAAPPLNPQLVIMGVGKSENIEDFMSLGEKC